MTGIWDELGIPPARDAKAIRRAYAARLKRLDPDSDPAAFQRLRQAYEAALEQAARPVPAMVTDNAPDIELETEAADEHWPEAEEDARPMPMPLPLIPRYAKLRPPPPKPQAPRRRATIAPIDARDALQAEAKPLIEKLEQAMTDFDATRAVQIFDEAMAKGLLPLAPDVALVTRLSKLALYDQALAPETFCRLMRQFGWHAAGGGRGEPSLASAILARLEAEGWYRNLVAEAAGRGQQARVARMLLGRNSRYLYYLAKPKLLRQQIAQYDRHKFWLSSRFDAKRMDSLRRNQAPKEDRLGRGLWWAVMALGFVATGLVRTCMDAMPSIH